MESTLDLPIADKKRLLRRLKNALKLPILSADVIATWQHQITALQRQLNKDLYAKRRDYFRVYNHKRRQKSN